MNFKKLSKILLAIFDFLVVRYLGTGTPKRIFIRLALKMIADVRHVSMFIDKIILGQPAAQAGLPCSGVPEGIREYPRVRPLDTLSGSNSVPVISLNATHPRITPTICKMTFTK